MARPKGQPKLGGRKKGTPNKDVAPIREKFQQLLDGYTIELMLKDLNGLEGGERLRIVSGLAEFIIPKMNRTEVKNDDGNQITLKIIRE